MSTSGTSACHGQSGFLRLDASLFRFVLFLAAPVPRAANIDPVAGLAFTRAERRFRQRIANTIPAADTAYVPTAVPTFTRAERREWAMVLELVMRPLTRRLGLWEVARGVRLQVPDAAAWDWCVRFFGGEARARQIMLETRLAAPSWSAADPWEYPWVAWAAAGPWEYVFGAAKYSQHCIVKDRGRVIANNSNSMKMPYCMATATRAASGGVLDDRGVHYFEFELVESPVRDNPRMVGGGFDGKVMFGFCDPIVKELPQHDFAKRDTWVISPSTVYGTPCEWYAFEDRRKKRLHLTDAVFFRPGSRVGLLLDLGAGTISVVQGGRVVGNTVMKGVTGPLLPCVGMRIRGQSIRVHGGLPVPHVL